MLYPDVQSTNEIIDEDVWLENWLHILAIAYSRWNGFLDCLVENIGVRFSQEMDEQSAKWLLQIVEGIHSYDFYSMIIEVRRMVILNRSFHSNYCS